MNKICVSIFMLTYNQEGFIAQTIESVMMQITNFSYQLVIGEDASTDKTGEICQAYKEKYRERVKLFRRKSNLGLIQNFIQTYKECDGKYVAILDGDDYWTDPFKLQKQVDYLENNPDYAITFTGFKKLFPDGRIVSKDYSELPETTDFKDLIKKNYICSATALFRNKTSSEDFPNWLDGLPYGDWPIYLYTVRSGSKIAFLPEDTAVYRMEIGVSGKLQQIHSNIGGVNKRIVENVYNDPEFKNFKQEIRESWIDHRLSLAISFLKENRIFKYLSELSGLILVCPLRILRRSLYVLKRTFNFYL